MNNQAEGERRKQIGLDLVSIRSEDFLKKMREEAIKISRVRGSVTVDALRSYADNKGIEPHHPNAWGSVFRGSNWNRIAMRKSKTVSAHARMISVWKYEEIL